MRISLGGYYNEFKNGDYGYTLHWQLITQGLDIEDSKASYWDVRSQRAIREAVSLIESIIDNKTIALLNIKNDNHAIARLAKLVIKYKDDKFELRKDLK